MKLSVDTRQIRKLVKDLEKTRAKALPYATREFVNSAAFLARDHWIQRAESTMKLRSQFTKKSIQVDKARGLQVSQQVSRVGSIADYMLTQEDGATIGKKGRVGTPIPAAAPGKRKSRGRLAAKNRLQAITLAGKGGAGGTGRSWRQRRNAAAISIAARHGGGVVFLDLGKRKGLYRISGTKRGLRVKKVWDLSQTSVRVPRNPMLEQTMREMGPLMPGLMEKALLYQLRFHKVMGYG